MHGRKITNSSRQILFLMTQIWQVEKYEVKLQLADLCGQGCFTGYHKLISLADLAVWKMEISTKSPDTDSERFGYYWGPWYCPA